ncbi:hypothetical protein [Desulfoluna sp.]|uniref:hypothetical protein n=1 Tax=Desulfoluna sp. TaxID=2045199 RepID=UPI0026270C77|nr:hypothetical protein [Desulfoluna sp.]
MKYPGYEMGPLNDKAIPEIDGSIISLKYRIELISGRNMIALVKRDKRGKDRRGQALLGC